jgi:starch-binding outer membrane protein SusE/F
MKSILKIFLFIAGLAAILTACDKKDTLRIFGTGTAPVLTSSATTVAPVAADSNKTALALSWSSPNYATDSTNMKYTVEIDSTGKNFSKETTKVVTAALGTSFTAKELNNILLAKGYAFNVPVDMDVRVTSSYANNNERLSSNVVKIRMTPYKIPPKVALPTTGKLFIVGDATQGGWNNPVPTPAQEFSRLDETTFAGIFNLVGGKEYLLLPQNGDWGHKFSVADKSKAGLNGGGDFGFDLSDNFPGPATSGWYKIVVDFQAGKFTVTPYTGVLPTNLYIVGDATAGGWNNPVPLPSQQFTRLNSAEFEITIPLIGSKEYLLLPLNGDWGHKYAVKDKTVTGLSAGGDFGYDLNDNFPAPSASGTYKINVNFATGKFTVK